MTEDTLERAAVAGKQTTLICHNCRTTFPRGKRGAPARYCSPRCRSKGGSAAHKDRTKRRRRANYVPKPARERTCIRCDKVILIIKVKDNNRKYCSIDCSSAALRELHKKYRAERVKDRPERYVTCLYCSKTFARSEVPGKIKYCSDRCRYKANSRTKNETVWCKWCGTAFIQRNAGHNAFCSQSCKQKKWHFENHSSTLTCSNLLALREIKKQRKIAQSVRIRLRRIAALRRKREKRIRLLQKNYCRDCSTPLPKENFKLHLCGPCRAETYKRQRRIAKSKRRAQLRKAPFENLDPIAVFERDEWRCYLCGIDTPAPLRGSYEPNAPELDHIIPLSRGGAHALHNVACACRSCNSSKGDSLPPKFTSQVEDNNLIEHCNVI